MPPSARPIPKPTMPASASGVSNTRPSPKRACRPSVARNTPPITPTSWPNTSTRSSRPNATASASLTACTMVMPWRASATGARASAATEGLPGTPLVGAQLGVDVLDDLGGGGVGRRVGLRQRRLQLGLELPLQLRLARLVPGAARAQHAPQPRQRLLGGVAARLRLVAVTARVVGGGVGGDAVGERLDQRGPLPRPRARHRLAR